MIPRLSGRNSLTESETQNTKPLLSKSDAQKIIQQFFKLIERFSGESDDPAPETKHSISRHVRKRTKQRSKP